MDKLEFDINIKHEKNADIYINYVLFNYVIASIQYNPYKLIMSEYIEHIKTHYNEYYKYIIEHKPVISIVKPITPHFYRAIILLSKLKFGHNIFITSSDNEHLEAILYLNINKNIKISQYVLNSGNTEQHLKRVYNDYSIFKSTYGDTFNIVSDIENKDNYSIDEFSIFVKQNNDINFFMFHNRNFYGFNKFKINELEHFYFMCCMFNTLKTGGSYLFRTQKYSKNYMYQILYILAKYFDITLLKNKYSITFDYYIYCENYKQIQKGDNDILLQILEKWSILNPNSGINLNYSNEKLREKYGLHEEFDKLLHYDTFVINIIKINSPYPESTKKIYDTLFTKLDKYYEKLERKTNKLKLSIQHITDDALIKNFKETYMNSLSASVYLLQQYNIPIKPEYINTVIKYDDQIILDTITIPQVNIIQLFDYDIICPNDIKTITNVYFDKNRSKEKQIKLKFGGKYFKSKPIARFGTMTNNIEPCDNKFKFEPHNYTYIKNDYTLTNFAFEKLKNRINVYKLNIDAIGSKKWSNVANTTNISQGIIFNIKNRFNINVTRGFVKMYELCVEFKLVDTNQTSIKTFHTCEAPGHFINATNHYIKSHNPKIIFDWHANTLNPDNDHVINELGKEYFKDEYGYIKKYKHRWLFGEDDTGDIRKKENIINFKNKFNYGIDLFTSDCGIGSTTKYDFYNQELQNSKLCFSQCLIALETVRIGGNALFKVFTPFSEVSTLSIIFLMTKHFEFIYFVKQLTGGPENSEVYIIGKNKLKHLDDEMEKYLFNCLDNYNPKIALFPLEIYNKYFILQMEKITKKFLDKQIKNLVRTFYYADNENKLKEHTQLFIDAKLAYSKNWIANMEFSKIDLSLQL